MAEELKHWQEHLAYKDEDLEIKNEEELKEAKEAAGVTNHEEAMKWFEANEKAGQKFKAQKAEWVSDNQIDILFKRGDEISIVKIKVNESKDGGHTSYQIDYPEGDWETDSSERSISEILAYLGKRFGIEIPAK